MKQFVVLTCAAGVPASAVAAVFDILRAEAKSVGEPLSLFASAIEISFEAQNKPPIPEVPGVDINVVAAKDRVKKLLIADMDSTIITVECIDELADFAGKKAEVSDITERAMRGELDFEDALRARVSMLKGVKRTDISKCHHERVKLTPGALDLVSTMNSAGAVTALVSGGFTAFTDKVVADVGFQYSKANELLFSGDELNGKVGDPICHSGTKLEVLNSLLSDNNLGLENAIAVGDGANDAQMVKAAGLGVAFQAKPALREVADAILDHSDLSALLALQGLAPNV